MSMSDSTPEASSMVGDLSKSTDPMLALLIDALSGKGQIDSLALLRTQLDARAGDNPQAAQILRLLEQNRQQQNSEPQEEEVILTSDEEAYSDHGTLAEENREVSDEYVQELEETVNRVFAELEELRARNNVLAAALGACHLCFGDDAICKKCGGRGVPGSLAPKPAPFRKYILPALRRVKAIETERSKHAPLRDRESTSGLSNESPKRPRRGASEF